MVCGMAMAQIPLGKFLPKFVSRYQGRFVKFCLVGFTGFCIQVGLTYLLTEKAGIYYIYSLIITIGITTTSNFILNNVWTFKDRKAKSEIKVSE